MAPWSLALGAIALSVPALSDQAGEARNDIVGIFFLLAAVAIALNARRGEPADEAGGGPAALGLPAGALVVVGLAAGLAAGTKLNFLLPGAVLVIGLAAVAPRGRRLAALAAGGLAALAGGGYWYLRNLVHTGNPLPWFDGLGPISLPAPDQALGGREAHSVLGYLTDGSVWSEWFLPGLHHGLGILWPLLVLASALAGLAACPAEPVGADRVPARRRTGRPRRGRSPGSSPRPRPPAPRGCRAASSRACATWRPPSSSAWRCCPPPRFFATALAALGRAPCSSGALTAPERGRPAWSAGLAGGASLVVAAGYVVQRHYLRDRYANPTFTTPGLNAAFKWATPLSGARIATTSTRQYPLFGTDLSNRVEFVGEERPHGGFVAPSDLPRLAPPPRRGRLRLRRRQPRPGRTGQAALPRHRPLDRRPRRHRRPAQAAHRRLQAHRPPDPSTCPS